jgi:hypothetical protein
MQCPQCGDSLEADFGVATCSKCHSVLFVDMDGNVQLSENSSSSRSLEVNLEPVEGLGLTSEMPPYQDLMESPSHASESASIESVDLEVAAIESQPEVQFTEGELDLTEAPVAEPPGLSSVSQYANSDQAYGPLTYSVTIEAIDTREIRQQVLEALADQKFQWDTKEIGKRIKSGRLKIENLNPVKASVLIHRLQDVPVKVSWIQNVYA